MPDDRAKDEINSRLERARVDLTGRTDFIA